MIKRIGMAGFIIFSVLCFAQASIAAEAMPKEYSCKVLMNTPEGSHESTQYVSGPKMRMDSMGHVSIIRHDLKVMWILMAQEKMYMEQPLDLAVMKQTQWSQEGNYRRTSLGQETVRDQQAEKFLVEVEKDGTVESMHQWMGGNGLPVRMQALDQSWTMDYLDFNKGPQDAALFEPPADYQKMEMPNFGALGQMMQQMQQE